MDRFWRRVHRQAWGDARQYVRTRLGYAVFLLILLACVVFGVKLFGTSDGWIDDLVGALIWLAALIIVFASIYGRTFLRIPPSLYEVTARRWRDAEARAAALEREMQRMRLPNPLGSTDRHEQVPISYVELAHVAASQFGWDFTDPWQAYEFADAVKHGCNYGVIELDGKPPAASENFKTIYFGTPIQQSDWRVQKLSIYAEPADAPLDRRDNWNVVIASGGALKYRDPHVLNPAKAVAWLREMSHKFKGAQKAADEAQRERRKLREAEEAIPPPAAPSDTQSPPDTQ